MWSAAIGLFIWTLTSIYQLCIILESRKGKPYFVWLIKVSSAMILLLHTVGGVVFLAKLCLGSGILI